MPTYEYVCTDCGHRVEVSQRVGDEPPTVCDECGGPLRKVFHPVGVVLKGSGFYKTDSRTSSKPSPKEPAKKGGGSKPEPGSGTQGGEGKPSDAKGSEGKGSDSGAGAGAGSGDSPKKESA